MIIKKNNNEMSKLSIAFFYEALSCLMKPIKANLIFFVFTYLLMVICSLITGTFARKEMFFEMYVVCLLLMLLPQKWRVWVRTFILFSSYLLTLVDIFCFDNFGSTMNPAILMIVSETNVEEVHNFLSAFFSIKVLSGHILSVLTLSFINILVYIYRGKINKMFLALRYHLNVHTRLGVGMILSISLLLIVISGGGKSLINDFKIISLSHCRSVGELERTVRNKLTFHTPFWRLYYSVIANRLASKQVDDIIRVSKETNIKSCSHLSPDIVLIIGESYGKRHSSLYGYFMDTTPRQKKLEQSGNLIKFTDVVSPMNATSFVFKNMFSTYVIGNDGTWSDEPLFPYLFRKAGYHVTFLSNEFVPDINSGNDVFAFSGGFFMNQDELSKLLFDERNQKVYDYDESLLKIYASSYKAKEEKYNFTIFHLIGQHFDYKLRYPQSHAHFDAEDYKLKRKNLSQEQRQILSDYDNATYYNDSIVYEIINRFAKKDAVVIYVPDHGEECYEGNRNIKGRTRNPVDWNKAKYQYEIPFWIYCSPAYKNKHGEIYNQIITASHKPFMTDALPHLLLHLGGISTQWYSAKYDILSPNYDTKRKRLLEEKVDYDLLKKQNNKK